MLSTVKVQAGDRSFDMKLGARAMMKIERETGEGILNTFAKMQGDSFSVSTLIAIATATMADGRGGSEDDAIDLIDTLGLTEATQAIIPVIEAAFPQEGDTPDAPDAADGSAPAGKKKTRAS